MTMDELRLMANLNNSSISAEYPNIPCGECGTFENLTRHHLKIKDGTKYGKRTGQIQILCESCHHKAEITYNWLGIIDTNFMITSIKNKEYYNNMEKSIRNKTNSTYGISQMRNTHDFYIFLNKIMIKRLKSRDHKSECYQVMKLKRIQTFIQIGNQENLLIKKMYSHSMTI